MSATRDKTQKITFVYSNLYSIYRQGVERAREGATTEASSAQPSLSGEALSRFVTGRALDGNSPGLKASGAVIKAADAAIAPAPQVSRYSPTELLGKRVPKPSVLQKAQALKAPAASSPVESLKQNLKQLNDLQARLRFMLQELEDLIKE